MSKQKIASEKNTIVKEAVNLAEMKVAQTQAQVKMYVRALTHIVPSA